MTVNFADPESKRTERRRVWDLPVRVIHGLFIVCVAGAWLTRDARQADWHAVFGYCALGLVAFRVAWGFIAFGHARFASFAYGPRDVIGYLRAAMNGVPRHYTGHNPAGSWAVFALLALLAATAVTGVLVIGGLHGDGPLAGALSYAAADLAREWHEWLAWAMLALVAFHLAGVAWGSRLHRENLAAAMVTGRKTMHGSDASEASNRTAIGVAIVAAAGAFASFYLLVLSPADVERRTRDEANLRVALNAQAWHAECGACHLAYSPALLPERSWRRTFAGQNDHFGEDLGIAEGSVARLLEQAGRAMPTTWSAWKLARSAPAGEAPLRITELPFWRAIHEGVPPEWFRAPLSGGKHDCEACHSDAASGIFHPRMIHIPKPKVES